MHGGHLLLLAAAAVACAPAAPEPRAPLGLAAPPACREPTLTRFAPSVGKVRVVRHSRQTVPARAIVAYERFACGPLALERCFDDANAHAQARAFELGLAARLLPVSAKSTEVDIAYVERQEREHVVAAADVEYEAPWGAEERHAALEALYDDLDAAGIELAADSDRELRAVLATPVRKASREQALFEAPRVFELALRCKPRASGR